MNAAKESKVSVLLVDDDKNVRGSLARILRASGFTVSTASDGEEALGYFSDHGEDASHATPRFDVAVVDLKMPGMDGQRLLEQIRSRCPRCPVVILTGYGTVRSAVDAMRSGAFEFLVKPSSPEEIISLLNRAAQSTRIGDIAARDGTRGANGAASPVIVGQSRCLRTLMSLAERVAATPSTVLIEGESGTGKELMARAIHSLSPRARDAFVAVNCAAVTPGLGEALFFGHRKGTFTGAQENRRGYFQAAHGGSLFLDEVSDLPEAVQGVLLRALQEGRVLPVGATSSQAVDVRVISATNRDLEAEVRGKKFRQDLFYRLNVIKLRMPPLRERLEDLIPLIESILDEYKSWFGFGPTEVSDDVIRRFMEHCWPGNVRELRNVIERAFAVCENGMIETHHLPTYLQGRSDHSTTLSALEATERTQIKAALAATNGEKKAAAELLGIDRKRLYRRLRRLGLYG